MTFVAHFTSENERIVFIMMNGQLFAKENWKYGSFSIVMKASTVNCLLMWFLLNSLCMGKQKPCTRIFCGGKSQNHFSMNWSYNIYIFWSFCNCYGINMKI